MLFDLQNFSPIVHVGIISPKSFKFGMTKTGSVFCKFFNQFWAVDGNINGIVENIGSPYFNAVIFIVVGAPFCRIFSVPINS